MATPRLPFDSVESRFRNRTRDIYNSMVSRFTEKRDKNERVIKIGRRVPFNLEDFRAWMRQILGGENGVAKCPYCAEWLSIDTLVIDHRIPVKQGGDLGLDNLQPICKRDNDQKGGLTGESYQKLLDWSADNLPPECRADMLSRLAKAVKLAAQRRWDIVRQAKATAKHSAPVPISVPDDDEPF